MAAVSAVVPLSARDLRAIIDLVHARSGISLHEGKRELVVTRLQRRLRDLGLSSYRDYLDRVRTDRSGRELTHLLDAIATNHTSFFREPQHFAFLRDHVVARHGGSRGAAIEGWCAAASTGEEPATIAMTLFEAGVSRFRLLASDLSTRALETARRGVYPIERVREIDPMLLRRYFERGLGEQDGLARLAPAVRRQIEYRAINLVEMDAIGRGFHFIFCRNVMIYFDRAVQQRVVSTLEQHLLPGGFLFISHAETLNGIAHDLQWVAPAVFQREGQAGG